MPKLNYWYENDKNDFSEKSGHEEGNGCRDLVFKFHLRLLAVNHKPVINFQGDVNDVNDATSAADDTH
jgi:hypothetical protein